MMEDRTGMSLYGLQERIRRNLAAAFPGFFWVRAEINSLKTNASGHCYLDLVDKETPDSPVRAQARAVVWGQTWRVLRPFFLSVTGRELAAGMRVLVRVQVQFSELYGLTLVVSDLDPSWSVGEEELMRRQVLARLEREGVAGMNRSLPLPRLVRRLAVVSSETAAGYRDFVRHLSGNGYGFSFVPELFPAPVQGQEAPAGIVAAMDRIAGEHERRRRHGFPGFDAVAIVRGGGAAADLRCFDDYSLALHVAQFPLPVLVAVGHDQDRHIVDEVAAVSVRTPTALANWLTDMLLQEDAMLQSAGQRLEMVWRLRLTGAVSWLDGADRRLTAAARLRIGREKNRLELAEHRLEKGNPMYLTSRGYALALRDGRRVSSIASLDPGTDFELVMADGKALCRLLKKD